MTRAIKQYRLVVGDWSANGHNQHDDFLVTSNADCANDLASAYRNGVELIGVDVQELCIAYTAFEFGPVELQRIQLHARKGELDLAEDERFVAEHFRDATQDGDEDDGFYWQERRMLNPSLDFAGKYFVLWRATALIGNPDLTIDVLHADILPIGGYGVYD